MIDSSFGADRGWRRFSHRQDGHMSFNRKRRLSRGAAATRSAEPLCRYRIGAGYHRPLQQRRARAITRLRCWPYCYLQSKVGPRKIIIRPVIGRQNQAKSLIQQSQLGIAGRGAQSWSAASMSLRSMLVISESCLLVLLPVGSELLEQDFALEIFE